MLSFPEYTSKWCKDEFSLPGIETYLKPVPSVQRTIHLGIDCVVPKQFKQFEHTAWHRLLECMINRGMKYLFTISPGVLWRQERMLS